MKVKSESEVTQSCPTLSNPTDCSLPASSIHGIFQARVLEWVAIAFSDTWTELGPNFLESSPNLDQQKTTPPRQILLSFMVLFKRSLSCAKSQMDTDLKYLVGWYLSSSSQCGDSFLGSEDSSPLWHHSVKYQGLCVFTVMPSALSCVGWNITVFARHKVDWKRLWTDRQVCYSEDTEARSLQWRRLLERLLDFQQLCPAMWVHWRFTQSVAFFWHWLLHKTIFSFLSFPLLFPSTPWTSWSFLNSHSNSKESKQNTKWAQLGWNCTSTEFQLYNLVPDI